MESTRVKRKLAAIVSMDVKEYSRLMAEDDVQTVESLKACREMVGQKILEYNGRVVDSPGDNLLSEFPSVTEAVECAVLIQKDILERNKDFPEEKKMRFRIGINLGDVIEDEDQIYGDGINLAARLEGMADPGGICISASAYDQVKNKRSLGYKFMGDKKVKNMPDPVPVYQVLTDPKYQGKLLYHCSHDNPRLRRMKRGIVLALIILLLAVGFVQRHRFGDHPKPPGKILRDKIFELRIPDKPSIAVLPFMNMSGELDQEYFSDGLTEDLITDLSKVSGLFVISRNSAFSYKGKNVKVEEISRDLGVRYVLEGSVRKVEERVRITAQLIDAKSGGHVWAERYDRDLKDIFSLQDEVRGKIVSTLAVKLTNEDQKRLEKDTNVDLVAYDYYLRGKELHSDKSEQSFAEAKILFQKAIEKGPDFAKAYSALGHTMVIEWIFNPDQSSDHLDKALELGEKTLAIDPASSEGHALISTVLLWKKQHDQAVLESRKAVSLDPNNIDSLATLGEQLIWAGQPKEGIEYMSKAMRLDPNHPSWYLFNLGHAYFLIDENEQAVEALEESLETDATFWPSHVYLAICYDNLGQLEKAKESVDEIIKLRGPNEFQHWEKRIPYKDADQTKYVIDRLKKLKLY